VAYTSEERAKEQKPSFTVFKNLMEMLIYKIMKMNPQILLKK
jgi:predicted CoA-binding protein